MGVGVGHYKRRSLIIYSMLFVYSEVWDTYTGLVVLPVYPLTKSGHRY